MMNTKKITVVSVILYLLAGLVSIYSVWAMVQCNSYIKEAVDAGQLIINDSRYDIANFYMSNCAQYMLFAVILFALGRITMQIPLRSIPAGGYEPNVRVSQSQEDDELDQWFEEMKMTDGDRVDNES